MAETEPKPIGFPVDAFADLLYKQPFGLVGCPPPYVANSSTVCGKREREDEKVESPLNKRAKMVDSPTGIETYPGWEKGEFEQYCLSSTDDKLFWCSPQILCDNSNVLRNTIIDDELKNVKVSNKNVIMVPIESKVLDKILRLFHGKIYPLDLSSLPLLKKISMMINFIHLEAHKHVKIMEKLCLSDISSLGLLELDRLDEILYKNFEPFVRQLYTNTLSHYGETIQQQEMRKNVYEIDYLPKLVIPEEMSLRGVRMAFEEYAKLFRYRDGAFGSSFQFMKPSILGGNRSPFDGI